MARPLRWPLTVVASTLLLAASVAVAAPPTLSRVEATADGYALVGSGFGTDKSRLRVFEDSRPVATASIVSVANGRIVVRGKPAGQVQHKVVVGEESSAVVSFNHAVTSTPPPALTQVISTASGYALRGAEFGTDATKVVVYEGATKVAGNKITSVTASEIQVASRPTGRVDHKVLVGGKESKVVAFDHPAAPQINRVTKTSTGYTLDGSGFGSDKTKVEVLENATAVSGDKVTVKPTLITVTSKPAGSVQHKVKVNGVESAASTFDHGTAQSAARTLPMPGLSGTGYRTDAVAARTLAMPGLSGTGHRADAAGSRTLTMPGLSGEGYR